MAERMRRLWTCERCAKVIPAGRGTVALRTARDPLPNEDHVTATALHDVCQGDLEPGYWIDVARVATIETWVRWVHFLAEKTWTSKHDVARMLAYWFSNRGEDVRSLDEKLEEARRP